MDCRKIVRLCLHGIAVNVSPDGFNNADVNRCKRLQIPFGMPGRDTCPCRSCIGKVALPAGKRLSRFTVAIEFKVVWILLRPFHRALFGVNAECQSIFFPGGDLTYA